MRRACAQAPRRSSNRRCGDCRRIRGLDCRGRRRATRATRPGRLDATGDAWLTPGLFARARFCGWGLAFGGTFGRLAFRHLALGQLLALCRLLRLGLDFACRQADAREHGLLRVVEIADAVDRRQVGEAERVADGHAADVEVDVLGNLHRQGLDVDLALYLREHTALLDAGRLADQLDGDARLDRLVESYLVQIDV